MLETRFALDRDGAEMLIERADRFDMEVDDVPALIEMMRHGQHAPDKERLLGMAYRVAAADGVVGEFESDLLWRLGRLLGFGDDKIDAVRSEFVASARPA